MHRAYPKLITSSKQKVNTPLPLAGGGGEGVRVCGVPRHARQRVPVQRPASARGQHHVARVRVHVPLAFCPSVQTSMFLKHRSYTFLAQAVVVSVLGRSFVLTTNFEN